MAIILTNKTNRRVMFDLPHEAVCADDDSCTCEKVERSSREHNVQTGEVGVRTETVRIPRGLILAPRGSTEPLPDTILEVSMIRDLIRAGTLVQTKEEGPKQEGPKRRASGFYSPPTSGSGS